MSIIIGLGNIGQEYAHTRHNIGFDIVDLLAKTLSVTFAPYKGPYVVAEGLHRSRRVVLVKPTTYMNRSGIAVKKIMGQYKASAEDILVIYDDLNLPLGEIKLKNQGSSGGHNGISDIIEKLGSRDFARLRFGIGNHFARGKQVDFVLSPFNIDELDIVEQAKIKAHDAALSFVREGITKAMNYFN